MATHEQTDTALALWRDAHSQIERGVHWHHQPEYEHAARVVYRCLTSYTTVPQLVDAYYRNEGEAEAETAAQGLGVILNLGIVEDAGYYLRYAELLKGATDGP